MHLKNKQNEDSLTQLGITINNSKKNLSRASFKNNGKLHSLTTHVTQCIPGTTPLVGISKEDPSYQELKEKLPSIDVKKIFFSKNEKYMVLITKTQAVVVMIHPGKFEVLTQIDLPEVVDYGNCDN